MAKRKKKKDDKEGFQYKNELYGLCFVLFAVLGIGPGRPLGVIGKLSLAFSVFLFGTWNIVFLLFLFLVGMYMIIKRAKPRFFNSHLIGLYIVFIGILVYSHMKYGLYNSYDIFGTLRDTADDLRFCFNTILDTGETYISGGGMIGCIFTLLFDKLFDESGTKIVSIALMVVGAGLFTGVSIFDFIRKGYTKGKELIPHRIRKDKDDEEKPTVIINDNNEPDNKLVISSIDELAHNIEKSNAETTPESIGAVKENKNYKLPPLSILNPPAKSKGGNNQAFIERNIGILENTLKDFGIIAKVVEVNSGPSVTQYELEVQSGTKLSKITSVNREISLALAKKDVRIQAPIPGKSTVGIEIANDEVKSVSLREIMENIPSNKSDKKLLVALGKNIMGKSMFCEIDKTPHLLVAGATGSGKSVCINCMIASILMRTKPDEVKLMMVDPKKVELSMYNGIPHLMMPVVTDPKKASVALQKVVHEMEMRYDTFSEKNVKNITAYNEWVEKQNEKLPEEEKMKKMHYIVVIVDELADLMVVASKEVEDSIMRITQMARAAGIHLIIATQRPSTDVITGVIKANIPSRISFAVSSNIDSRTILDQGGAEKLLGRGDMLFLPMGENIPERIQGAYVSDEELEKLVNYTVSQQKAMYDERFLDLTSAAKDQGNAGGEVEIQEEEYDDPLYNDIVEFVVKQGKASASLLQRRFKLGYNRAARIVDLLEERGIIGPQNGSKPREVLVKLGNEEEE